MIIDSIVLAYKKYIEGKFENGREKMWYGSEDQVAPNTMHDAIAAELEPIARRWGYAVRSSGFGGEVKLKTEIHNKDIDIAIVEPSSLRIVLAISFKMPMSSVNKNIKNFGEGHIGDTALIKESGTTFFYIALIDRFPILSKDGLFSYEELSDTSLGVFTDIMSKPRSNKYRSDVIFIIKSNFNDRTFKESKINLPFLAQNDRKTIALDHLSYLSTHLSSSSIVLEVKKPDGTWTSDFEREWNNFIELVSLELALDKIRKKHF